MQCKQFGIARVGSSESRAAHFNACQLMRGVCLSVCRHAITCRVRATGHVFGSRPARTPSAAAQWSVVSPRLLRCMRMRARLSVSTKRIGLERFTRLDLLSSKKNGASKQQPMRERVKKNGSDDALDECSFKVQERRSLAHGPIATYSVLPTHERRRENHSLKPTSSSAWKYSRPSLFLRFFRMSAGE